MTIRVDIGEAIIFVTTGLTTLTYPDGRTEQLKVQCKDGGRYVIVYTAGTPVRVWLPEGEGGT